MSRARTGHQVTLVSTPNSSAERLALYQQILAVGADDIGVLQVEWYGRTFCTVT